jgi:Flp pilus assembly protein TadB
MFEKMLALSERFPPIPVKSGNARFASKFGAHPAKYASLCLALSIPISFFLSLFFLGNLLFFIAAFFLLSMLVFLLLLMLPRLAFNKKKAEVEAELPLFLRTLSMLLELKIPFHTALETLSRERFAISRELGSAVKEIRRGATVEAALASLAKEFDSLEIKRAVSQVLSAYESGGGAESIKKISDDMFFLQQHRMKEFSSKQAMFSLLFIAASTILPSVYLIFSVLGKVVFSSETDPFSFIFVFLVGFPLLSGAILAFSSLLSPTHSLEEKKKGTSQFFLLLALAGLFVLFSLLEVNPLLRILVLFLALLGSSIYFYPLYKKEKYREAVEDSLPDALLSVSGNTKLGRLESIFSTMRKSSNPQLSAELSISIKQLQANIKPSKALDDLWERNSSLILKRVSTFFTYLFEAGVDAGNYVSLMAEDLFRLFEMRRERRDTLSMQKYTLIFGALILPLVLGNSLSLISEISDEVGGEGSIVPTAALAIPAYLIIYSFLASHFIAEAESRKSSELLYFASLSMASTILFYLFSGTTLL